MNKTCELCNENKEITKHHPIPISIIKRINPNSKFKKVVIDLCEDCHKAIHNHFLEHIIIFGNTKDGFNKIDGAKYLILKKFLKEKHNGVYHSWKVFFREFCESIFKEFDEEKEDKNETTK